MKLNVTKKEARRFLLQKQLLLEPQSLESKTGVEKVFTTLRLIQYDPLNPCGRNTDLVLQSRIRDYHPDGYINWLYKEKKGIECYDKELCIVPIEDLPLARIREGKINYQKQTKAFLKKHQKEIEILLQKIEKEGPLTSSNVDATFRVISNWGTSTKFGSVALELLWKMGRLVVVKRENGKKWYDIPRDNSYFSEKNPQYTLTKEHVLRRLQSVGLLPAGGGGGGWQGLGPVSEIKKLIQKLIDEEKLTVITIEGIDRKYVINANDTNVLHDIKKYDMTPKKVTFIAPLDNLMWDRQMIHEVFNFYYRWEVYAPVHKRVYGYYVLPILYGDEFIGRIEPVLTQEKNLLIKVFHMEDKNRWNDEVKQAFMAGLESFKQYVEASEIINNPII